MAENVQLRCSSLTRVNVRVDLFYIAGRLIGVRHLQIFFPAVSVRNMNHMITDYPLEAALSLQRLTVKHLTVMSRSFSSSSCVATSTSSVQEMNCIQAEDVYRLFSPLT